MSKADDLSRQYKDFREQCGVKDPVMLDEIEEAYYEGYQQAEKNLELTWEDIREICRIWIDSKTPFGVTGEALSIEVLKRFKDLKK